jgi:hypothetical protein
MSTALMLRIAAILAGLRGLAHGALFVTAKPRHGDEEVAVIVAMMSNRFFARGAGAPGHHDAFVKRALEFLEA